MPLAELITEAEERANDITEDVRSAVYNRIAQARDLTSWEGSLIRDDIKSYVDSAFGNASRQFEKYIREAFTLGFGRANSDVSGIMIQSHLTLEINTATEIIQEGFNNLSSSIRSKLITLLHRSKSDEQFTKESLFDKIGRSLEDGMFRGFASRARGIVSHELEQVEADSYHERSAEIDRVKQEQSKLSVEQAEVLSGRTAIARKEAQQLIKDKKIPLTIKRWRHSSLGQRPRIHHVEMDGMMVPFDMDFQFTGVDEETRYSAPYPHAPNLPTEETAFCRCSIVTSVVYKTEAEILDIRRRAQITGGYRIT